MKVVVIVLLLPALLGTVAAQSQNPIQHVVVIFQENRSPDNLFHGLPGADIATSGINSKGKKILLTSIPLDNNYDLDHTHRSFLTMYDDGKMDGADKLGITCSPH